jgi:CRISPR-associated protein Cas2
MTQHQKTAWLVLYDISHPRRLARVFKVLKKEGVPVQYSVFAVDASAVEMAGLMVRIAALIDEKEDDVRAYRLPVNRWCRILGNEILPAGTWLL